MCITLYIVGELGGKTKCKLQLGLTGRMHATMQHTSFIKLVLVVLMIIIVLAVLVISLL